MFVYIMCLEQQLAQSKNYLLLTVLLIIFLELKLVEYGSTSNFLIGGQRKGRFQFFETMPMVLRLLSF